MSSTFGGGIGAFWNSGFDFAFRFRYLLNDVRTGFCGLPVRICPFPFRQFPNCIPSLWTLPMTALRVTPSFAAIALPESPALVRATNRSVNSGVHGLVFGRTSPIFLAQCRAVSRHMPSRFAASSIVGAVAQCFRRASISLSDKIRSFIVSAFGSSRKLAARRQSRRVARKRPRRAMASRLSTP